MQEPGKIVRSRDFVDHFFARSGPRIRTTGIPVRIWIRLLSSVTSKWQFLSLVTVLTKCTFTWSVLKDKKLLRSHETVCGNQGFAQFSPFSMDESRSLQITTDPDPGDPKTHGSGSGELTGWNGQKETNITLILCIKKLRRQCTVEGRCWTRARTPSSWTPWRES